MAMMMLAVAGGCTPGPAPKPDDGGGSPCQGQGSACRVVDPCCSGLVCNNVGLCAEALECVPAGESCAADRPCCTPLTCSNGICRADDNGGVADGLSEAAVPDFSVPDVNAQSPRYAENVSPRDYLGHISAWYFGHST
jgi:hypothetical protein